jgi:hypothetical protein
MGHNTSLLMGELISLGLTTFLYGAPIDYNSHFYVPLGDDDGLSANRTILYSVCHQRGDDILFERAYASTSHKDPPGVIPDVSGGYNCASTFYRVRSYDQLPVLSSSLARFRPLGPGSAGVYRSEGR